MLSSDGARDRDQGVSAKSMTFQNVVSIAENDPDPNRFKTIFAFKSPPLAKQLDSFAS